MKLKALLHPALALKCRKPLNKNHAGCNKTKVMKLFTQKFKV